MPEWLKTLRIAVAVITSLLLALPGVPWQIRVQVLDESTNALPGVEVDVDAVAQLTTINKVFGTPIKRLSFKKTTDKDGRAVLNFKAHFFKVGFSKSGFVEQEQSFIHDGTPSQPTNQDLKISLAQAAWQDEERNPH